MARLNWNSILEEIDNALEFFRKEGVKPTLRTLFYNLVSKNLIPNTRSSYQTLSKQLVEARKLGRYSWNFLEDKTRVVIGSTWDYGFSGREPEYAEKRAIQLLDSLDIENVINEYFDDISTYVTLSKWFKQPIIPEVWIEKEALSSTVASWLSSEYITIRVNKGYSSWTFIYNNTEAIKESLRDHEKVIIYYLGDLDPSGVDIQRFLNEALEYFKLGTEKVVLKRLAITPEQVEKYNLPPKPEDAETLEKISRDPRTKNYNIPYVVELDALIAYVPNELRKLLEESIKDVWDESLYDKLYQEKRNLEEQIKKIKSEYIKKARRKIINLLSEAEEEEEEEEEDDDWF